MYRSEISQKQKKEVHVASGGDPTKIITTAKKLLFGLISIAHF